MQKIDINKQQQQQVNLVTIYIRNSQKKANILYTSKNIYVTQLRKIVSQKIHIQYQKLLLFLNGLRLLDNQYITVKQKDIIHYVNLSNVGRQNITIHIQKVREDVPIKTFKVNSRQNIKAFINNELSKIFNKDSTQIFLVYMGKMINNNHSFQEQLIQDQAQLMCAQFQHSRKQVLITKTFKRSLLPQDVNITGMMLSAPGKPHANQFFKKQEKKGEQTAPSNIKISINNPQQTEYEHAQKEIDVTQNTCILPKDLDQDAKKALQFILHRVPNVGHLLHFKSQIVAGTNYIFIFSNYNGPIMVWSKPWQNNFMQITLPNGQTITNQ